MPTQPEDQLSDLLQQGASRFKASEALKAQIRTSIAMAELRKSGASTAANVPESAGAGPHSGNRGWRAVLGRFWSPAPAAVGGFALGVVLSLALVLPSHRDMGPDMVPLTGYSGLLVSDHVRAIGKGPLFEVASSDRHTVKPWFQGKLDYAPPMMDLADAGFPLVGARIDHLQGRDVAVLVFRHGGHIVSLYVSPSLKRNGVTFKTVNGFQVGQWSNGSMAFWLIADMDSHESSRFVQAWSEAEGRR